MKRRQTYTFPGHVLGSLYGRTSKQLGMSEKRRDEVIAAAIFACFRNQEFGTQFKLPSNYREIDHRQDAQGIDIVIANENGRSKKLQIKGIHIQRSIERRRKHRTKGSPRVRGRRSRRQMEKDSKEIESVIRKELLKIVQDYTGIFLIIHIIADLATQTSVEVAIRKSQSIVENLKAKEIWLLRNIPVYPIYGKRSRVNCHAYQLMQISPNKHTYSFSFAV